MRADRLRWKRPGARTDGAAGSAGRPRPADEVLGRTVGVARMSSASDHNDGSKGSKARMFFQYGNDAALKANFGYAIQMYQEACKLEPGSLLFRQALRGIERRKFGN